MGTFECKYCKYLFFILNQARSTLLRVKPLWLPWSIVEKDHWVNVWFPSRQTGRHRLSGLAQHLTAICGLFCPNHHKSVLSGGTLTSVWPVCDPLGCTGNIAWHLSPSSPTSRKHICRLHWTGYPFSYHMTHCYLLSYGDNESIRYRLRVVSMFPHVSADVPSPWGYIFRTPTAQLVGKTTKGPKYVAEVGVTSKAKNKDFFFLLLLLVVVVFQIGEQKTAFDLCKDDVKKLYKGQKWIELIYRVNSESLKKKKKKNFTSSGTQTACERKRSLIHCPLGISCQCNLAKKFPAEKLPMCEW